MAFKNIEELAQGIAAAGQNWSDADRALAAKDIDYGNSLFTLKNDWVNATKRGDSAAECARPRGGLPQAVRRVFRRGGRLRLCEGFDLLQL